MRPDISQDIAKIGRITAVPAILRLVSEVTGLRFAAVARVTHNSWTACAVLDRIDFGLAVGGELDVATTLCREVRAAHAPIVIEHVSNDANFCGHPTPAQYGFQSYLSVPIVRRNGEVFGTICALDPLPRSLNDGKILPMVQLYAELIAAQLEVEDELDRNRVALHDVAEAGALREQFVAVLGHDLRNPIAAVLAGAKMLQRQPLDDRSMYIARQIESSGRRMATLVDDVLDLARAKLGEGMRVEFTRVANLGEIITSVLAELEGIYPHRRLQVSMDISQPIRCDANRVSQLVSNLVGNALTHGSADVDVQIRAWVEAGALNIEVSNGGVIPAEVMPHLFQPYTRHGQGTARGLGLGLYIASQIAHSHGATLTAQSTEETGTRFQFHLPNAAVA